LLVRVLCFRIAVAAFLQTPALVCALSASRTGGVRVWGERVTGTTRRELGLTHAVLANVVSSTEGVRIVRQWITVTFGRETLAHDAPVVVGTDGVGVILVTVAARGVDGAARICQFVWRVADTHLLNDTVVTRLFVKLGFTEINDNIRMEAIEETEDDEDKEHDDGDGGGWLAVTW